MFYVVEYGVGVVGFEFFVFLFVDFYWYFNYLVAWVFSGLSWVLYFIDDMSIFILLIKDVFNKLFTLPIVR